MATTRVFPTRTRSRLLKVAPVPRGKVDPARTRTESSITSPWLSTRTPQPVIGRLGTDRPHQFKLQGSYSLDFGLNFGLSGFVASGTPISREGTVRRVSNFYLGRLSDGRTPLYSNWNLLINQRIPLGRGNLELRLNITNLFNQKTVTTVWAREQQDDIAMDLDTFFAGFDVQQQIRGAGHQARSPFSATFVLPVPKSGSHRNRLPILIT